MELPYANLGLGQGDTREGFCISAVDSCLAKKHFFCVLEVAKLFVHNGTLKFHFHMKLVNNGFQDSLNKRG